MTRAASGSRRGLAHSFKAIREILLQDQYRDRLQKPLAHWTLPNDRRLPLAFLNRTVGELLETPFEELSSTPGIGQKKISSLVKLLRRATDDDPPTVPLGPNDVEGGAQGVEYRIDSASDFNACLVSEALWSKWTAAVRAGGLGDERLGRVAESLAAMPTVIWTKKLGDYQNLTLAEIRSLRTHGEKRVRCVMQVFHRVYETIQEHHQRGSREVRLQLGSQRILAVSEWVHAQIANSHLAAHDEVREHLAKPILRQVEADCGHTVYEIARQRLGLDAEPMSVREQAHTIGVTRARIYQLLDDCHKVLEVRWPGGRPLLDRMTAQYGAARAGESVDASLFLSVRQLCFPDRSEEDTGRGFSGSTQSTPYLGQSSQHT